MNRRRRQRIELLAVPSVLAVLAAGLLIGFVNLGGGPQVGTITARSLVDGEMVARIEAPAPYSGFSGSREVVVVKLIAAHRVPHGNHHPGAGSIGRVGRDRRDPPQNAGYLSLDRGWLVWCPRRAGDHFQSARVRLCPWHRRAGDHATIGSPVRTAGSTGGREAGPRPRRPSAPTGRRSSAIALPVANRPFCPAPCHRVR